MCFGNVLFLTAESLFTLSGGPEGTRFSNLKERVPSAKSLKNTMEWKEIYVLDSIAGEGLAVEPQHHSQ